MSTESDSVKSVLSEANDKDVNNENHTDESSQDSVSVVEQQQKNQNDTENNVNNSKIDEKEKEKVPEENSEKKNDAIVEEKDEEKPPAEPKKLNVNDNKKTDVEEQEEKVEEDETDKKSDKTVEDADSKEVTKNDTKIEAKTEEKAEIDEAQKTDEEKEVIINKDNNEQPSTASEEDVEEPKNNVPLLDQPLETTGKRERKNVQRFEEDTTTKTKEPAKIEFEDGTGTILSEIPRVEASITRFKNDDLKFLHRLLFNVQGNKNLFKKNIRKFNGFGFKKASAEYEAKVEFLKKNDIKTLKTTCEILDLMKTGTKDDLIDRILDFLVEPKDTSKPTSGGRPKRATAVRANNRGYSSHDDYSSDERHASRVRRDKGKRSNLKDDTSSDEEFKPGDVSDASDEKPKKRKRGRTKRRNAAGGSSDEDEASLTEATSDESDDAPKTKRRKSVSKSSNNKGNKTPGRRGRPGRAATVSQRSRGSKRGRKTTKEETSEDEEEEEKFDENSSSEDEPLAKKKTKASEPPSDDEIKTFIKNVLEGANLEEITMKNVCQRVYDNYPDFDLTSRKNFIKSTVKSLIST